MLCFLYTYIYICIANVQSNEVIDLQGWVMKSVLQPAPARIDDQRLREVQELLHAGRWRLGWPRWDLVAKHGELNTGWYFRRKTPPPRPARAWLSILRSFQTFDLVGLQCLTILLAHPYVVSGPVESSSSGILLDIRSGSSSRLERLKSLLWRPEGIQIYNYSKRGKI